MRLAAIDAWLVFFSCLHFMLSAVAVVVSQIAPFVSSRCGWKQKNMENFGRWLSKFGENGVDRLDWGARVAMAPPISCAWTEHLGAVPADLNFYSVPAPATSGDQNCSTQHPDKRPPFACIVFLPLTLTISPSLRPLSIFRRH